MYFTIDMGSTQRKESKYHKINLNALAMGPSRRTFKNFLTKIQKRGVWALVQAMTAINLLTAPYERPNYCAVVRSVFIETASVTGLGLPILSFDWCDGVPSLKFC